MADVDSVQTPRTRSSRLPAYALGCLLLGGVLAAGCEISPVVSTQEPTGRYHDCERAAEAYCEHVEGVMARDLDKCVAEYRYRCVSGD